MWECRTRMPISLGFAGKWIGKAGEVSTTKNAKVRRTEGQMIRLQGRLLLAVVAVVCRARTVMAADEFLLDGSRPACGKVCKLVCETKKLTAICYGSENKDICLPEPSRAGCKHCAVCYGKSAGDTC